MRQNNSRKWMTWGVLAAAVGLLGGCTKLPQGAGNGTYHKGFVRGPDMPLYNGTIADIPTSIDPRTPDKQGTPNNSLAMDPGERALLEQREGRKITSGVGGYGGSGPAPTPGMTPYKSLGAEGSMIAPSSQLPASQSLIGTETEPANTHPAGGLKK
jgi:hypothetical protein